MLLGLVVTMHAFVDPFPVFPPLSLTALAPHRGIRASGVYKSEALRRTEFDTLVLGASRVALAIHPEGAPWGSAVVFDASLGGAHIDELEAMPDFALENSSPARVFLFVDFLQFNPTARTHAYFDRSRLADGVGGPGYVLANLSQTATTVRSLKAGKRHVTGVPGQVNTRGHIPTDHDGVTSYG